MDALNNDPRFRNQVTTLIINLVKELTNLIEDVQTGRDIECAVDDLKLMLKAYIIEIQDDIIDDPYSGLAEADVEDVTDTWNAIEYNVPDRDDQVIVIEQEIIDISDELSIYYTYPDDFIIEGQEPKYCGIENYIIIYELESFPIYHDISYDSPIEITLIDEPIIQPFDESKGEVVETPMKAKSDDDYLYAYQISDTTDYIDYIVVCTNQQYKQINPESIYKIGQFGFSSKINCQPTICNSMDDIAHQYYGSCIITFDKVKLVAEKTEEIAPHKTTYYKPTSTKTTFSKYATTKIENLKWIVIMDIQDYNNYYKEKHINSKFRYDNRVIDLNNNSFTFYVNDKSLDDDIEKLANFGYNDIPFSSLELIGIDVHSYLVYGYSERDEVDYCYIETDDVDYEPHSFVYTTSYKNNKAKYDTIHIENIRAIPLGSGANLRYIVDENGFKLLDTEQYIKFTGSSPSLNQKKRATKWFNKK